jgi:hypothetical protein
VQQLLVAGSLSTAQGICNVILQSKHEVEAHRFTQTTKKAYGKIQFLTAEVLTPVNLDIRFFWDMTPCSLIDA